MSINRKALALIMSMLFLPGVVLTQGGLNQRIDELSQQIATEMAEQQKTTIAVIEFTDLQGNVTDLGRFIAEELITRLFQTKQFKVIERQLLNKVLSEQDLSLTGIIDPTSAKALEKILGVDAIASGTITDLAQSLRVNARLISTETGEIFAVASTEIFKDESVMMLLAVATKPTRASSPMAAAVPATSSPSEVRKTTAKEFVFELKEVKRSGTTLSFQMLITNAGQDRRITLYSQGTRIFDESGNEYAPTKFQLGNKAGSSGVANSLVSGIPVKMNLIFEKVSAQAGKITLLEIAGNSGGGFKVQIRDIPIPK